MTSKTFDIALYEGMSWEAFKSTDLYQELIAPMLVDYKIEKND